MSASFATHAYSSLFTQGLLAPPVTRSSLDRLTTPDPPSPAVHTDRSLTPTPAHPRPTSASSPSTTRHRASSSVSSINSRALRRRRSSISTAGIPLPPLLKTRASSGTGSMGALLARARGASISEAQDQNARPQLPPLSAGIVGRMRSGSLAAFRSGARRLIRKAPAPPPTSPLPPLPPLPAGIQPAPYGLASIADVSITCEKLDKCRPLARRTQTAEGDVAMV